MTPTRSLFPALTLSMLIAGVGFAQIASPDAAAFPTAPQMLANRLTLLARHALVTGDQSRPLAAQITQARILLDQANTLDNTDPERWLLTAEACGLSDDADAQIDALKQYMRLAPDDDVAQLRLIDMLVAKMQTADQRQAYLLKIAEGPLANRFSGALRSRIAFRAAFLAAAQGEPETYGRLLSLALQLDSTNKPAAAESVRVLSASTTATAQERAAAMLTLFQADPTDARTHAAIGNMLLACAQYADAIDWFAQSAQIENANHRAASISLLHEWAMALWGAGRGADAVKLLAQLDPPPTPAGGADSSAPATANPDWPPLDSLMLRATILANNGTEADLAIAYKRLNDRLVAQLAKAPAPGSENAGLLAAQVWSQLLCNQNTDQTAAILDKLAALPNASDMQLPLMRGWLAMRTGNHATAAELLTPLADVDPRAALGLAMGALQQPDAKDQSVKLFRRVVLQSSSDIFGMIAASQLRRMSLPLPEPDDSRAIAAVFAAVPSALRQMSADPLRYVQVRLTCPALRFDFGQPITANLEIRNVSNDPLSIETGGAIPSRLLLLPSVIIDMNARPQLSPTVVNLDRRLRLDPLRSMSIPIRLDTGSLGALLTAAPWSRIQIDELAILNPTLNAAGSFTPGMLGSTSFARGLVRRNIALTAQAIQQKIVELGSSDPAASMRAMAMLVAALPADDKAAPEQTQAADAVTAALTAAWLTWSPIQQAYGVSLIPADNERLAKQLAPVLSEAARSTQPLVQLSLLTTQVHKADDPVLTAALRSGDATVRNFAQAKRDVLASPPPEPGKSANP